MAEEEEQKGFIVDDDYLSVSEMNYSNISSKDQNEIMADLARKKAIIQKNRESKEVLAKNHEMQGPRIFMYDGNKSLMSSFKAVSLVQDHA